jgi:hypothetical protein
MTDQNLLPKDLETLSAALDRQLKPQEQAALDARLKAEPGLRAAFDQLRLTRSMLRNAPRIKAPRDFTLSPDMLPQKRTLGGLMMNLRTISVIASILFTFVFAGDLFYRPVLLGQQLNATAVETMRAANDQVGAEMNAGDAAEAEMAAPAGEFTPKIGEAPLPSTDNSADLERAADDSAETQDSLGQSIGEGEGNSGGTAQDERQSGEDNGSAGEPEALPTLVAEQPSTFSDADQKEAAEGLNTDGLAVESNSELSEAPETIEIPPSLIWIRFLEFGLAFIALSSAWLSWRARQMER